MTEYQTVIRCRGTHPRPRFQDFDKSRTGHVSRTQFSRVLNQLGIMPPEAMLTLLLKRYLDKGNMEQVNYMDFCKDVDTPADIFRPEREYMIDVDEAVDLHKTMRESAIVRPPKEEKEDERPELTSEEHMTLEQCLQRLGTEIMRRRLDVKPLFRDVDTTNAGWLTTTRFAQVFNAAQLPISDEEQRLLAKRFANKVSGVKYPELEEVLRYYSGELAA
jgi:Ca2+-binding EF-hand superfamily protein